MEITFTADCPYCSTRSAAFVLAHENNGRFQPAERQSGAYWYSRWMAYGLCRVCDHGVIFFLDTPGDAPPSALFRPGQGANPIIHGQTPGAPDHAAPMHTPEPVARLYRQGAANLPQHPDAAGAMFRKALEQALTLEFPQITGTLFRRIQEAVKQGALTSAMGEWADQIRLDGNEAVHGDEPFSVEDARRLETFTSLVFLYLFTLPGMLKEARGEANQTN